MSGPATNSRGVSVRPLCTRAARDGVIWGTTSMRARATFDPAALHWHECIGELQQLTTLRPRDRRRGVTRRIGDFPRRALNEQVNELERNRLRAPPGCGRGRSLTFRLRSASTLSGQRLVLEACGDDHRDHHRYISDSVRQHYFAASRAPA